jgi:trk system potassium uptake protein TrkA
LKEAAIESIDHVIAVTDDEKTNILSALLSKSLGAKWSTALVNTFSSGDLVMPLGIDSIVLPRSITVSSILRHIYQGHIRAVYSICDGAATLFDIEVPATSNIVGGLVGELALAEEGRVVAIVRGGEVHIAHTSLFVQAHDRLIVMAVAEAAKKLESMLLMQ